MARLNLIIGLLALALFAYAQLSGWSLFSDRTSNTHRSSGSGSRIYHK